MKILKKIEKILSPSALTIGNFDGVHLGHQKIISEVLKFKTSIIITFSNHPSSIIANTPTPLICTLEHKLKLIEEANVDTTILLEFTKEFSDLSPDQFIQLIRKDIPFTHLILGHDARFGKDRKGTQEIVKDLADHYHFSFDYIPPLHINENLVSSTLIRRLIQEGNLTLLEKTLGRKYSIYSKVIPGKGKGKTIGFPTSNIDVSGLSLPPFGVYKVTAKLNSKIYQGIANLGIAPTVRNDNIPILETHLFNFNGDTYGSFMEVIFESFIRPEKKFSSIEELRSQLKKDMISAESP